jgi:hypothetical protein
MPRLQVAGLATGIPGLAALAVFGILGGVGVSKEKSLREQCAPDCDSSQVRGVERLYFGADLAFTIGGICTLTGATMYLVGRLTEPDEASVGLQLRAAPSEVALVGSF